MGQGTYLGHSVLVHRFQGSLPERGGMGHGTYLGHSVLVHRFPGSLPERGGMGHGTYLGHSVLVHRFKVPFQIGAREGEGTRHRSRSQCAGYTGSRVPFHVD
jgi:hypothetical protein